jgi:N-acetylglucosamine-6-phosphate deacetylase
MHIHGIGGHDVWHNAPESIRHMARIMVRFGTTAFLATTFYDLKALRTIRALRRTPHGAAQCLGLYLEGPFISRVKRGAILRRYCVHPEKRKLERILRIAGPMLKVMTVAPELDGAVAAFARLRRAHIVPAIGHSNSSYQVAARAIEAGARHATHLFNAMRTFISREPGVAGAALADDNVSVEVIADGAHIHPTTVALVTKIKPLDKIILITDSLALAGMPPGSGPFEMEGKLVELRDGALRFKNGTISGSILTMDKAVRNTMQFAGVSLRKAVMMATLNVARLLGVARRKGRITPGADADLVILDRNLDVETTIARGVIAYQRPPA